MIKVFVNKIKLFVGAVFMLSTSIIQSQELLCEVNLVTNPQLQITTVDKDIIDNLLYNHRDANSEVESVFCQREACLLKKRK